MYGSKNRKRPPGYELFFAPLEVVLNPNDVEQIGFAYVQSKAGHAKQERDDGSRYFDHPKRAAWIYMNEFGGRDTRLITILLLHDIREDSYLLSAYRISLNLGEEIALDVRAVTKLAKGKEPIEDYGERMITRGPYAMAGKLFDRLDNVRHPSPERQKTERHCSESREYYVPVMIPKLRNCGGVWEKMADFLEEKFAEALNALEKHLELTKEK